MFRIFLIALVSAISLLASNADAYAVFVTEKATVEVQDPNGQAPFPAPTSPLVNIRRIDTSGGNVFTNQVSGAPFAVGGEVRTVSASQLMSATDGVTFTPLQDNRLGATFGNDLVFIAAIRGTITSSSGGTTTASFDAGRGYIVSLAPGTFDPRNPDTFGFASVFVEFDLAPPETVVPGQGQALAFDKSVVNQSSANTTSSNQADGRFLFLEDSDALQNADPQGGDNFITVTTNTLGAAVLDEGILSQTFQTVEFADLTGPDPDPLTDADGDGDPANDFTGLSGPPLTATDLVVLNTIFTDMSVNEGLGPLLFATGFGPGLDTNYNPQFPPGAGPTGDFRAELQTRNAIGIQQIVPEPSSFTLFGIGLASAGIFGCLRRRKVKNQA